MTTALRTADIWALAENAKRREDEAEAERKGLRATALLGVIRRVSETCGVTVDAEECEVILPGEKRNRYGAKAEAVVEWQGAQWRTDGHFGSLWCHRPEWREWRPIRRLADLAG